jgi:indole-3-glycerol phosphate synthase
MSGTHLDQLVEAARESMRARQQHAVPADVAEQARAAGPTRPFVAALLDGRKRGAALIAEIKRASPSRGPIAPQLHAGKLAQAYERGGAACLSVLTEERFFKGSLADLISARAATGLPVLRKDFLVEPYQILEARAHGADAVLLIAAALSLAQLGELSALARQLGMAVLLEVHEESELEAAAVVLPDLLGINARNLKTLEVDNATFAKLAPRARGLAPLVAESGIKSAEAVRAALVAGASALLVGEALSGAADPEAMTRELVEAGR